MKSWVKILILVAALALCVGACFFVIDYVKNSEDKPEDDTVTVTVGGFDSEVVKFSYAYEGTETEFELVNYSWQNTADREMPLKQESLDALAKIIRDGATSVRMVDDSGELVSSADFGLEAPELVITASNGMVSKTMKIGKYNSAFKGYYANVEGSAEVHLISADLPESFMADVFVLAVEAEAFPEIAYDDVIRIHLFDGEAEREMAWSEGGSEELYSNYYTWFEENEDGTFDALRTTAMTVLCESIVGFSDITCIDYAPESLEAYGLDKDYRGFDITYIGEIEVENEVGIETQEGELELEVRFSKADADGKCYMTWSGNTSVYSVSAESADAVMNALTEDLSPDEVCAISLDTVESFNVAYNGAEINVVRTERSVASGTNDGNTVTNIFTANGIVVDSTNVNTFYDGLLALTVEGRAEAGSWEDGAEPHMTVTFIRNTETFSEMTLTVYEYSVNFYRISFNGEDDILVSIRDIDNMGDAILKTLR